jgi:hypothetical protein
MVDFKKKSLFNSKLDFNLMKKLTESYIWSAALYGAETWTLRSVNQKYLQSFEMWCWGRKVNTSFPCRVKNEKVLHTVQSEMNILHTRKSNER